MSAATVTSYPIRSRRIRHQYPDDTVFVGYGTEWASQFRMGGYYAIIAGRPMPVRFPEHNPRARRIADTAQAAELYSLWLDGAPEVRTAAAEVLRGYNLECDCAEGAPCHADALLAAANN